MKLYLVVFSDPDGESQDFFVLAHYPDQATHLWNEHRESLDVPDAIYRIPFTRDLTNETPRVLHWFSDIPEVEII